MPTRRYKLQERDWKVFSCFLMFPVLPVVLTLCSFLDVNQSVILFDISIFLHSTVHCVVLCSIAKHCAVLCSVFAAFWNFNLPSCMAAAALWIIQPSILPGVAAFSNISLPFCMVYAVLRKFNLWFCLVCATLWNSNLPFYMTVETL